MRKILAVLLATAMSVTPVLAVPATTTANVNMRSGPGTNFDVLATVPSGTSVDLGQCDSSGAWCEVTANGKNGFMSGQYLQEQEDKDAWPRSFETSGGGRIVLYQPQVTAWDDFKTIQAQIAAEYVDSDKASPVFGVIGVSGTTQADSQSDEVVITDVTVTDLNFSALDREKMDALNVAVGNRLPSGPITISEQRLTASLAEQKRVADVTGLKSDPPPIFHAETAAILVQTNGKATMAPVQNVDGVNFVVNTNWDILQVGDTYYLRDEESWLSATDLAGPWAAVDTLPPALANLPDDDNWKDARAAMPPKPFADGAPTVFYSDTPAELILFDGPPKPEAVPGTALEWMSNTQSDVFFDTASKTYYVLLSGRWFSAASLDGPWTFATPNLPDDFKKIPADTPYYSVRYSVPGTSESDEARLKASIPHTARVEIGSVTPDVAYGGDPQFAKIEGTEMSYATNTNADVIEVEGRYFVLQNGVWFVGDTPTGPFQVASEVPDAIYTIPPSSPVYNVTYVRVYDTEPGAAWFGYTMGYLTGYLAWGTYVYGSGWYYPPYWYAGNYRWPGYYPRAVTYGMGAYYNPVRGVYGRYGYAYGPYRGIAGGAAYNPRTGTYIRGGAVSGPAGTRGFIGAYNPRTDTGAIARGGHNVYGSWGTAGVKRGSDWARVRGGSNAAGGSGVRWNTSGDNSGFVRQGRNGNVYAGRDGNVYRNTGDGWEKHDQGGDWSPVNRPSHDRTGDLGGGDGNLGARPVQNARPAEPARRVTGPGPEQPRLGGNADAFAPGHLDADFRGRNQGNVERLRDRGAIGTFDSGFSSGGGRGERFSGGGGFGGRSGGFGGGGRRGGGGFRR